MPSKTQGKIVLVERDYDLFTGLFESRIMTSRQADTIYFDGKYNFGKRRIRKLMDHKFIGLKKWKNISTQVIYLTEKGFSELKIKRSFPNDYYYSWAVLKRRLDIKASSVPHELDLIDIRIVFQSAFSQSDEWMIEEFKTLPKLIQFRAMQKVVSEGRAVARKRTIAPDIYISLSNQKAPSKPCYFFVERDRSTESMGGVLVHKGGAYHDFLKSGNFALWHGADPAQGKEFPFRKLLIVESEERRNNFLEASLREYPNIRRMIWVATWEAFQENPLGSIWVRPKDFDEATRNTPYDPYHRRNFKGYKRSIEREKYIASRMVKHPLFDE